MPPQDQTRKVSAGFRRPDWRVATAWSISVTRAEPGNAERLRVTVVGGLRQAQG